MGLRKNWFSRLHNRSCCQNGFLFSPTGLRGVDSRCRVEGQTPETLGLAGGWKMGTCSFPRPSRSVSAPAIWFTGCQPQIMLGGLRPVTGEFPGRRLSSPSHPFPRVGHSSPVLRRAPARATTSAHFLARQHRGRQHDAMFVFALSF